MKKPKPARHWVPDELYEIPMDRLTAAARMLYAVLCRCTTRGSATVGLARLCQMVALSRRPVVKAIRELEDAGMLEVTRRLKARSTYSPKAPREWAHRSKVPEVTPVNLGPERTQIFEGPFVIWVPEEPNLGPHGAHVGSTAGIVQGLKPVSESIEAPEEAGWEDGQRLAAEASAFVRQLTGHSLGPPSRRR